MCYSFLFIASLKDVESSKKIQYKIIIIIIIIIIINQRLYSVDQSVSI